MSRTADGLASRSMSTERRDEEEAYFKQREIEQRRKLREKLEARGHTFVSQTDTESLVHLIESYYDGDLEEATRKALHDVRGSYAILAVHSDEPERVVGARNESPLVVGLGLEHEAVQERLRDAQAALGAAQLGAMAQAPARRRQAQAPAGVEALPASS